MSLSNADLTFIAEALGQIHNTDLALRCLRQLAAHDDPVVREGAVYGLATLTLNSESNADAVALLSRMAESDSNATIRACAREALEP